MAKGSGRSVAKRRYTKYDPNAPFYVMLREAERRIFRDALAFCDGVHGEAAKLLGLSAAMFSRRIHDLGGIVDEKYTNGDHSTEGSSADQHQPTDESGGTVERARDQQAAAGSDREQLVPSDGDQP